MMYYLDKAEGRQRYSSFMLTQARQASLMDQWAALTLRLIQKRQHLGSRTKGPISCYLPVLDLIRLSDNLVLV